MWRSSMRQKGIIILMMAVSYHSRINLCETLSLISQSGSRLCRPLLLHQKKESCFNIAIIMFVLVMCPWFLLQSFIGNSS